MDTSRIRPIWRQWFVSAAVCINVIGHGCILGYPAVLLQQLQRKDSEIICSEEDASWIASVLAIAMLSGIFITPLIMGRLGRKMAHYFVILTAMVAWLMIAAASSLKELVIARIFQGFSYGMFIPLRSILIAEYTSPKNRGAFLTAIGLAQGVGILVVHLCGSLLHWQWTAFVCMFFTFMSLVMTMYSPETPGWLADKGRFDECIKVFHWLRGFDEEKELEEMINARKYARDKNPKITFQTLVLIIWKKEFYKPVITSIHTFLAYSCSGVLIFTNFSTIVLGLVLGTGIDVNLWMVALDTQRIITNSAAICIINRTKRRTMMFTTLVICIASQLLIAIYVYVKNTDLLQLQYIWIPGILINLQYFAVGLGMVSLPGVIIGEVFPMAYKSIGSSITMGFNSVFTFVVLKTFQTLTDNVGLHGAYTVFVGFLIYAFVVLWFFLPETQGKTLQEIENEYKEEFTDNEDNTEEVTERIMKTKPMMTRNILI